MWSKLKDKILNFDNSKDLLVELEKRISNEEDVESIVCLLETSQNCQKLLDFINKYPDIDANTVWRKAISISES